MKGKSNIVDSSAKYVIIADSDSIDPSDNDSELCFIVSKNIIQLKITNFLKTLLI